MTATQTDPLTDLTLRDVPLRHYTLTDIICPACRRSLMVALLGADNYTLFLSCTGRVCAHTGRACVYTVRAVELLSMCQPAIRQPAATQPGLFAA